MDITHFLRRRSSEVVTPKTEKVNKRAALYKVKPSKPRMSQEEERRSKRAENLNRKRNISPERVEEDRRPLPSPSTSTRDKRRNKLKKEDGQKELLERLAKYRARKKEEREMASRNKKPIFKVGAVHHKPYPFDTNTSSLPSTFNFERGQSCERSVKKGLGTRSEGKLQESPVEMNDPPRKVLFQKENIPEGDEELSMKSPIRVTIVKTPYKSQLPTLSEVDEEVSRDKESTLTNSQTSSEEDVLFKTPIFIEAVDNKSCSAVRRRRLSKVSPLLDPSRSDVCLSRGSYRDQRRAEKGLPIKLTSPFDDLHKEIDSELLTPRITRGTRNEKDVSEFRKLFNDAKNKLTELANAWVEITPPEDEDIKGSILSTVGCARLFMDRKGRLQQFSNLVDNCEFSRGEKETTKDDLRGFWEMISCQADDIYKRFNDLKLLKDDDWKQSENVVAVKPKKRSNPKRQIKKEAKASRGLKAMLEARRARMKQNEVAVQPEDHILIGGEESKEFDGKFFKIMSPIRPSSLLSIPTSPASTVEKRRSINSSSLLRRSLLMNSVIKVTSAARRSLSVYENTPPVSQRLDFDAVEDPSRGESVPSSCSPKRMSLLPGMDVVESPVFPTNNDLMCFDSPKGNNITSLRRSRRLSDRNAVDCSQIFSGRNNQFGVDFSKGDEKVVRRSKRLSNCTTPVNYQF